ncbi:phage protein NinX family protein [Pantoea stewartii]|uniref:phage protein NinX family protein n=1 Tax=Pantoea stewartii TaxID=66269 RepID=UPI00162644AF|nr:phage protein NinX family protein [Pantoea stewartii]MBC0853870.1 DUF2591 family protein [Pantoea stewartii]
MNYSEMSDFEINGMVAAATQRIGDYTQARGLTFIHEHGEPTGGFGAMCLGWKEFDPCNSWSDGGPIIATNKITISAPMKYDDPSDWLAYPSSDSDICVAHPNPLRAAMTVFLVMRDITNE